jgi:adenosylcobinamide-phosphate guanylyltransferase
MCGGKGTRLDAPVEKPLYEVCGEPMVDHVLRGLHESSVDTVYAVVSPNAPETAAYVESELAVPTVETPGEGYVSDLGVALERVGQPVLTVAADLPLVAGDPLDRVVAASDGQSSTTVVPTALKRRLGCSVDADGEWAYAGINVVTETVSDERYLSYDVRVAVNVNRLVDVEVAEDLLCPASGGDDRGP